MINNQPWLFYALIFGAVLLGVRALFWLLVRSRTERKIINRRLSLSNELKDASQVLDVLHRERGFGAIAGVAGLHWLEELIVQSGMKIDPARIGIFVIAVSAALYVPLAFWLKLGPLAILIAFPVALLAGYLVLRSARANRINKFGEQLPEAIDIVVRGLRAGHPFRVALGLVAREMADPIGTEFGILLDEISFGLDQETAVNHLAARVGQDDLTFVSIAINIQSQTGGNLAEILQNLAAVLRNRSKLRLKVRALTSEGRLSGIFMSVMPFLLFLVVNLISPGYFSEVKDHPLAGPAVVAGLLLLGLGNYIIYRMVHFKF